MSATESVLAYHRATKHPPAPGRHGLVPFRPLDPHNRPTPFKRYPGLPAVPLPAPAPAPGAPAGAVLGGDWALARPPSLDGHLLAGLLFACAGVVRVAGPAAEPIYFRAAMSAGNLHPVEVYVVCQDLAGVPDGVHHLSPLELGLTRLRSGRFGSAPCALVLAGIPWRTCWKYGERGWRHLYWDAGTMLANLAAMASAYGVPARVHAGFVDAEVARLVGIDGESEMPLAVVTLGEAGGVEGWGDPAPLALEAAPVAPRPITFPLVGAVQRAGVLDDAAALRGWRAAAGPRAAKNGASEGDRRHSAVAGPGIEEVIRRRGSTRRMVRAEVPEAALAWSMSVAGHLAEPASRDTGPMVDSYLTAHAVSGLAAGTYRWSEGSARLLQARQDVRRLAAHLCLDQALGGDSAFTVFHSADLDRTLAELGPRGYRVVHLQAGMACGRLALAAFTLGYGATGLTFYDDEVTAALGGEVSCLLVTAVGVPGYRSRPGGQPLHPTRLEGFDRLAVRTGPFRRI